MLACPAHWSILSVWLSQYGIARSDLRLNTCSDWHTTPVPYFVYSHAAAAKPTHSLTTPEAPGVAHPHVLWWRAGKPACAAVGVSPLLGAQHVGKRSFDLQSCERTYYAAGAAASTTERLFRPSRACRFFHDAPARSRGTCCCRLLLVGCCRQGLRQRADGRIYACLLPVDRGSDSLCWYYQPVDDLLCGTFGRHNPVLQLCCLHSATIVFVPAISQNCTLLVCDCDCSASFNAPAPHNNNLTSCAKPGNQPSQNMPGDTAVGQHS